MMENGKCDFNAHKDETRRIIGCAMDVINELGHGFVEKPYENALVVEFNLQDIPYSQQKRYELVYKTVSVGLYIPDLIVNNEVVVDVKVIDKIGKHEVGQMLNYLNITKLRIWLIINFKHAKLEWKRVVL